jgi:hypothetical protein
LRLSSQSLQTTLRSVVSLGLPDGKIADFAIVYGKETIALYFRNYGQSIARNVVVETWPIILNLETHSLAGVNIPPPQKGRQGPDLPPGFPYIHYESALHSPKDNSPSGPSFGISKEELVAGKKNLRVIGRIQYSDYFGEYCEAFSIVYRNDSSEPFALEWGRDMSPVNDLCGKREASVGFEYDPTKEKRH